jgi:tetratricopeptide (TPR) repeat protein/Zn-dependent protease
MLGQIAIALLLFLGFLLYPLVATTWIVRNRVFECSRVEAADPSELPVDIQEALTPSIAALEAADFEFVAYQYIHAGIVGDPPAWGLLFRNATAQTYVIAVAPQPFHQYSIIICDIISVVENNHKIITTNSKNYKVLPQGFQETRTYRLNAPLEELLLSHQTQLEQSAQIPCALSEAEFTTNILRHNLAKVQYGVDRGVLRWAKPNEQYQYTLRSTLKLTVQVILEMIFPKTQVKRLKVTSELAQTNQVQSEVAAFLATLTPKDGLSKQKRGWLAISSLAIFATTYAIQFGPSPFGAAFVVIFLGALILHEGGHLAAMLLFGYRSPAVFFIPFFGALATARKNHASLTEKFWISMAGPLPGLILGIAIAVFRNYGLDDMTALARWYGDARLWQLTSIILIVLNLFNLLPIYPLDGGQIADLLLFSRNPYLGVIYRSIGVVLLLRLGSINPTMIAFGLIIAFTIPNSYRIARWSAKLHKELKTIPWQDEQASAELIFTRLQSAPKLSPTQRQLIAAGIFADRRSDSASWQSRLGLSIFYVVTLLAGIIGGLYSLMPSPKMMLGFANGLQQMMPKNRAARMQQHLRDADAKVLQNPKDPNNYRRRSELKSLSEDFSGALADANTAIQLDPKSPASYYLRSRIYRERGEVKLAQADDRKAHEIEWQPKFQAAHDQIKKNPKNLSAYIQRAEAKYGLDDRTGAFQDLDYVIKRHSKNTEALAEALLMRSNLYDRSQNLPAAIKDLDHVIELRPNDYEAYDLRSELYSQLGDDAKADADAQKFIELYDQSAAGKANQEQIKMLHQLKPSSDNSDD